MLSEKFRKQHTNFNVVFVDFPYIDRYLYVYMYILYHLGKLDTLLYERR